AILDEERLVTARHAGEVHAEVRDVVDLGALDLAPGDDRAEERRRRARGQARAARARLRRRVGHAEWVLRVDEVVAVARLRQRHVVRERAEGLLQRYGDLPLAAVLATLQARHEHARGRVQIERDAEVVRRRARGHAEGERLRRRPAPDGVAAVLAEVVVRREAVVGAVLERYTELIRAREPA